MRLPDATATTQEAFVAQDGQTRSRKRIAASTAPNAFGQFGRHTRRSPKNCLSVSARRKLSNNQKITQALSPEARKRFRLTDRGHALLCRECCNWSGLRWAGPSCRRSDDAATEVHYLLGFTYQSGFSRATSMVFSPGRPSTWIAPTGYADQVQRRLESASGIGTELLVQ